MRLALLAVGRDDEVDLVVGGVLQVVVVIVVVVVVVVVRLRRDAGGAVRGRVSEPGPSRSNDSYSSSSKSDTPPLLHASSSCPRHGLGPPGHRVRHQPRHDTDTRAGRDSLAFTAWTSASSSTPSSRTS